MGLNLRYPISIDKPMPYFVTQNWTPITVGFHHIPSRFVWKYGNPQFQWIVIEGSLEVKLPTIWTDGKAEVGRVREEKRRREKIREEKESGERRCRCEKVEKSRFTVFFHVFPMICGSGWSKSRLAKAAGAQMRDENVQKHLSVGFLEVEMLKKCTPLWREAHFQVNMHKTHHSQTTFGSWDVEKVHTVVARSTFRSQKCLKLTGSEHFLKLRCSKIARRCGAKPISKSKCEKHSRFGPLLDVQPRHTTQQRQRRQQQPQQQQKPRRRRRLQLQLLQVQLRINLYTTASTTATTATTATTTTSTTTSTSTSTSTTTSTTTPSSTTTTAATTTTTTTTNTTTLHYNYSINYNYNYSSTTLHSTSPHDTTTTAHYNCNYSNNNNKIYYYYYCNYYNYYNYYSCNYNITTTTTPATAAATLQYSYNYNCNCNYKYYFALRPTPHYIQQLWLRWPLQPLQKTQL